MYKLNLSSPFYLLVTFLLTRLIFYCAGVSFHVIPIEHCPQFIDPIYLKTRLLESILFLHSQPPLFNLFLGVLLKVVPNHYTIVCYFLNLGLGIVFMFTLLNLMWRLGVNRDLAKILTMFFMVNPAVIYYENFLFYTYPVAVAVCLAALYLHKFLESKKTSHGLIFFSLLGGIILTRSVFHPLWYLVILAVMIFFQRQNWKKILRVSYIPLLLVLLVYGKNFIITGSPTASSTWFGQTAARMMINFIPGEELKEIIARGEISPISVTELHRYDLIGDHKYSAVYFPQTGIPVLDEHEKPTSKKPNYNSLVSLASSKQYLRDAFYVVTHYPQGYLKALQRSYFRYLFPGPSDYTNPNRYNIQFYENAYNFMFAYLNKINKNNVYKMIPWYGVDTFPLYIDRWSLIHLGAVVWYYVVLVFLGIYFCLQAIFKKGNFVNGLTLFFIAFTIVYVTLIINGFDFFANNRYRFSIDALYIVLFGMMLTHVIDRFRHGRRRSQPI